jgi:hypothetical protein
MTFVTLNVIGFLSAALALAVVFRKRREFVTEFLPLYGVFCLVSVLVSLVPLILVDAKSRFHEIWNYKNVSIQHWEKWTTKEERSEEVSDGTDSKGNTKYRTRHYYETEEHGPYWYVTDEYGNERSFDESDYIRWAGVWNNPRVIKVNKGSSAGFDRAITGKVYECNWPSTFATIYPEHSIKRYVNKVRVNKNVWSQAEVSRDVKEAYKSPAEQGVTSAIMSYDDSAKVFSEKEKLYLERKNCQWGSSHQLHMMLITFDSSKYDMGIIDKVMAAWQGPNKNELCVFVGLGEGRKVDWVKVESWLDDTTLHALLQGYLLGKPIDVYAMGDYLGAKTSYWKRKEFEKDFAYMRLEIPLWMTVMNFFLQVGLYIGFAFVYITQGGGFWDNFKKDRRGFRSRGYRGRSYSNW